MAKETTKKITYEHFTQSNPKEKVVIIVTSAGLIVYPLCKVAQTLYAAQNNHRYKNIRPVNEYDEKKKKYTIQGPKIHIETSVDGQYIGHSSTELLQHFSKCWKFIKNSYPLYVACSGSFNFNMSFEEKEENNKKEKIYKAIQCFLKKYPCDDPEDGLTEEFGFENTRADKLKNGVYAIFETNHQQQIKKKNSPIVLFKDEQMISNKQEEKYALTPKLKSSCSLL